jgi:hypothetical protein
MLFSPFCGSWMSALVTSSPNRSRKYVSKRKLAP